MEEEGQRSHGARLGIQGGSLRFESNALTQLVGEGERSKSSLLSYLLIRLRDEED